MINQLRISEKANIYEALQVIDNNGHGVTFVVDGKNKIVGVATDGDIRRALIRNSDLNQKITDVKKNLSMLPNV